MKDYSVIAETNEDTVVNEYTPAARNAKAFQSEAALEENFIAMLCDEGYTYLPIHTEKDLINNLREQLERLNGITFSDAEWERFFYECIANKKEGIIEKSKKIQEDNIQLLTRDDGSHINIKLIDKDTVHNNSLQVINQYEVKKEDGAKYDNRYDVTILVNGLPLVHTELKRRDVDIKTAFNQINHYWSNSFWAGSGLYEYVQIFVISNGGETKYYSNSTRFNAIKERSATGEEKEKTLKTSNSYEFTMYWSDAQNKVITDLVDFTKTFFSKHTILNILTKYCALTTDGTLMVMRPYQITATERIINRIEVAHNYKKYGTTEAGGYIWHSTGSGKTLTSFKTARLATGLEYIDKVLFVVDRKDLDYQTMKEYDRFEKGAANSNTSTKILQRQLSDDTSKIIITTIQKLSTFIKKNKTHPVYDKQVVMIFDECHRSQFGDMHTAVINHFKKYYMFGFTGTPIFAANAGSPGSKSTNYFTTAQTFGKCLHTYTLVDAITDKNVLPFNVEYISTMKPKEDVQDEKIWDIDREKAFEAPERISKITEYILNNFDTKTYRNDASYFFNTLTNISEVATADRGAVKEIKQQQRLNGFNSILCVASVKMAQLYYKEFKRQMALHPEKELKIATIFSYAPNEEEPDGIIMEENPESTERLDQPSREFLEAAISDYNAMFHTSYNTSSEEFQAYYKDVSLRMKNRDLDLLIVVNMFLTGFDATTLNTLWVDKNLKTHGLIQAFSRTNRILNSVKQFGNIVCFRPLKRHVDDAISLFSDKNASGIILLRSFNDYFYGFESATGDWNLGYSQMVSQLKNEFPLSEPRIVGEEEQKQFISLFNAILRMRNLLSSFDEFAEKDKDVITPRELQDYTGRYLDLYPGPTPAHEKTNVAKDIDFEIELIKQSAVTVDYTMYLVSCYHHTHCEDKEMLISIQKAIESSPDLRSKKQLIMSFIQGLNEVDDVMAEWRRHIAIQYELDLIAIIQSENLNEEKTRAYMEQAFIDGELKTYGTDIDKIMPPISLFSGSREDTKQRIISKLQAFFEKFRGLPNVPTTDEDAEDDADNSEVLDNSDLTAPAES